MTERKQQSQASNTEDHRTNNKSPDKPNQGTVEHSDDGRLKENRDKGVHRGDKEA